MEQSTWDLLDRDFKRFPTLRGTGASLEAIDSAARELGVQFEPDLIAFLRKYGSATVGAYSIHGIAPSPALGNDWSLVALSRRINAENWPGLSDAVIFSLGGDGSPIGIVPGGKVIISDHLTGRHRELASSFEDFILLCLSA